jgi:hypothetical protein
VEKTSEGGYTKESREKVDTYIGLLKGGKRRVALSWDNPPWRKLKWIMEKSGIGNTLAVPLCLTDISQHVDMFDVSYHENF